MTDLMPLSGGIDMLRSYGKQNILFYLIVMVLLNASYMYVVSTTGEHVTTSQVLNAAFNLLFLFAFLYIYFKNRHFVNRPIIIQSILTQLTLLVVLFALNYALSILLDISSHFIYDFFRSPLIFMIIALGYAVFALLFANLINYIHNRYADRDGQS